MKNNLWLYIGVFISGFCAMLVEIVGSRTLYPYLGNTIFTWSGVIAVVLSALSIGYWYGGKKADSIKKREYLAYVMFMAGVFTLLIPLFAFFVGPIALSLNIILGSILAPIILAPASVLYGMVSPYAIKLITKKGSEGSNAGSVFAISTIGSILGVILTGFVLIPNLPLQHIYFAGALMMAFASLAVYFDSKRVMDVGVLVLLTLPLSLLNLNPFQNHVYQENSEYSLLTVVEEHFDGQTARTLYIDNAPSSGEIDGRPAFKYYNVTAYAFDLLDNPRDVLVLGCAAGVQVEQIKRFFPSVYVDAVDVDRKTVDVGRKYFSLNDKDGRTGVYIEDARRFVVKSNKKYDLIVNDAFRAYTPPPHLGTVEFLRELKNSLKEKGVVVTNVIARKRTDNGYLQYVHDTYFAVFKHVYVFPTSEDDGLQNIILIATDKDDPEFEKKYARSMLNLENHNLIITDELNKVDVLSK